MANSTLQEQLNEYAKGNKKRRYIYILIAIFTLTALFLVFLINNDENKEVSYITKKVKKGDLEVSVLATGNLNPTNSVDIGIEVSGTIKEIYVDFNDKVKVGQVLAKLDTTKLKSKVDSSKASLFIAKANLKESEVNVKNKKLNYERMLKMFEQSKGKYPSKNDLDDSLFSYESSKALYEAAKAKVMQAEYNLKTDQENLDKAVVKSSIDGIVLNKAVEVGQTVAASMSTPTLFTLAKDLSKMDLIVSIDEADVANIKEGLNVTFTVDAYPKEVFKGKIKQVRFNPISENGVVTYETVVLVDNKRLFLRPGMTASAKIITKKQNNVLLVPNSALRFNPVANKDNKKQSVNLLRAKRRTKKDKNFKELDVLSYKSLYILKNNQVKKVEVKVLQTDGKFTSIQSQIIKEGDNVITSQKSS